MEAANQRAEFMLQLKDLQVFTVIRVVFQLADEIPCISAVVVSLLSEVNIFFKLIFEIIELISCVRYWINYLTTVNYLQFPIVLDQPKPKIDYTIKAVGGSLTAIPGLSDMIEVSFLMQLLILIFFPQMRNSFIALFINVQDTVNTIVTDMLLWPHRIVVPLGGIPVDTR